MRAQLKCSRGNTVETRGAVSATNKHTEDAMCKQGGLHYQRGTEDKRLV